MKAEEIRKRPISVENRLNGQTEWVTETYFLREIAAQLAELNKTLSVFREVQASNGGGLCTAPEQK
jgi:hypothetical protein